MAKDHFLPPQPPIEATTRSDIMAKGKTTTTSAALSTLLDIQKKIAEQKAEIPVIDEKLATLNQNLSDFSRRKVKLAELLTQREDIVCDVYLGKQEGPELAAIETAISDERAMLKASALSVEELNSLMAGLNRRKVAIGNALAELEADRRRAVDSVIRETAEQVGASYVSLAGECMEQIKRLFSLAQLLSANGMGGDFSLVNNMDAGRVFLPATNQIKSILAASNPNVSGLLACCSPVNSAEFTQNLRDYIEAERQALLNAGVERLA